MGSIDEYMRVKDAAPMIGMTPLTIRRRIAAGEIDGVRDPRDRRQVLVRKSDVDRLLAPFSSGITGSSDPGAAPQAA